MTALVTSYCVHIVYEFCCFQYGLHEHSLYAQALGNIGLKSQARYLVSLFSRAERTGGLSPKQIYVFVLRWVTEESLALHHGKRERVNYFIQRAFWAKENEVRNISWVQPKLRENIIDFWYFLCKCMWITFKFLQGSFRYRIYYIGQVEQKIK